MAADIDKGKGIDLGKVTRFTWSYFRKFALGVLLYTPDRFNLTRVGDMLEAMEGYNTAELERTKVLAALVRTATTKLWNTQVVEGSRKDEQELWPFPWEADENREAAEMSPEEKEEYRKNAELQAEYLMNKFPDNGNSSNKS